MQGKQSCPGLCGRFGSEARWYSAGLKQSAPGLKANGMAPLTAAAGGGFWRELMVLVMDGSLDPGQTSLYRFLWLRSRIFMLEHWRAVLFICLVIL